MGATELHVALLRYALERRVQHPHFTCKSYASFVFYPKQMAARIRVRTGTEVDPVAILNRIDLASSIFSKENGPIAIYNFKIPPPPSVRQSIYNIGTILNSKFIFKESSYRRDWGEKQNLN
jgi:hypothetical protein